MNYLFEQFIAHLWNRLHSARRSRFAVGLVLGFLIVDGQTTARPLTISETKRTHHIVALGKTGTGKSTFLRFLAKQDIEAGRGFCFFDLHGDATPILLRLIAAQEEKDGTDLSGKLIVIEPADPEYSVGLNFLEKHRSSQQSFVQIAEFAAILKQRWQLDSFGARTEELLRNSLCVLADNGLTLLELPKLLTDGVFRAFCVSKSVNLDVKEYFVMRFDRASDALQAVYRDPLLNKISGFTTDRVFRHLLGQKESSFSLIDAVDGGYWILLNLDKGRLGEHAATLGSIFLTKLKNALFARRGRKLFSLYCDELQNLVSFGGSIDTLISESRKRNASICTANQFLDQYPAQMRSAILSAGTHVFFQLSSPDADRMGAALGGGRSLAQTLKNLPQRHMVIKTGEHRPVEAVVSEVEIPRTNYQNLYNRSRELWARRRVDIEQDIRRRSTLIVQNTEGLDDWE